MSRRVISHTSRIAYLLCPFPCYPHVHRFADHSLDTNTLKSVHCNALKGNDLTLVSNACIAPALHSNCLDVIGNASISARRALRAILVGPPVSPTAGGKVRCAGRKLLSGGKFPRRSPSSQAKLAPSVSAVRMYVGSIVLRSMFVRSVNRVAAPFDRRPCSPESETPRSRTSFWGGHLRLQQCDRRRSRS